jgi:hypothetical protein
VPSHTIDLGWHTFLLHTKEYKLFCRQVAGHFIHHVPDDAPPDRSISAARHARTITLMQQAGYAVDHELWAKCSTCSDEGNCSASGKDGDENKGSRVPK